MLNNTIRIFLEQLWVFCWGGSLQFLMPPFWKWISPFFLPFPYFLPPSFIPSLRLSLGFVNLWVNNRICQVLRMMLRCGVLLMLKTLLLTQGNYEQKLKKVFFFFFKYHKLFLQEFWRLKVEFQSKHISWLLFTRSYSLQNCNPLCLRRLDFPLMLKDLLFSFSSYRHS